jgi:CheY-like chemotaxis protein
MARILVVDDEPLISALTEDWLSELGHIVVGPAHDLAAALKLAEAELDAAIVDVSLGDEMSYPLADALSARGVPFALATGYGPEGIDQRYRTRSTLGKPYAFATFRRVLDELLAQSRSTSAGDTARR